MFTEPDLFDLEMELIFEKCWIYACHESEISNPHDFVTMQAGRQPMIVTRDGTGNLNGIINACAHRGTTLTRVSRGHQSTFTCPFHAWTYKSDGRLIKVKAGSEYPEVAAHRPNYQGRSCAPCLIAKMITEDIPSRTHLAIRATGLMVAQSPPRSLVLQAGTTPSQQLGICETKLSIGGPLLHVADNHQPRSPRRGGRRRLPGLIAARAAARRRRLVLRTALVLTATSDPVFPGLRECDARWSEQRSEEAEWMMHRRRNLNI
jgi:nitrite reductase/ring-hydroxylating ferredoxin subunit